MEHAWHHSILHRARLHHGRRWAALTRSRPLGFDRAEPYLLFTRQDDEYLPAWRVAGTLRKCASRPEAMHLNSPPRLDLFALYIRTGPVPRQGALRCAAFLAKLARAVSWGNGGADAAHLLPAALIPC